MPMRMLGTVAVAMLAGLGAGSAAPIDARPQPASSTPSVVAALENPDRAVYRYRVAIVSLLELKPGMTAADVGAGSGFIARLMAPQVAPGGKVIATELDTALVRYINDRAHADNLGNLSARMGQPAASALDPSSVDAMVLVETFSVIDRQREMLQSLSAALKPGGLIVVVDAPREGQGTSQTGIDADDVVAMATAAGLTRLDENGIVPGHYAIRFRKPEK